MWSAGTSRRLQMPALVAIRFDADLKAEYEVGLAHMILNTPPERAAASPRQLSQGAENAPLPDRIIGVPEGGPERRVFRQIVPEHRG